MDIVEVGNSSALYGSFLKKYDMFAEASENDMIDKELEFDVNIEKIQIGKLTTKVSLMNLGVFNCIPCRNFSSSSSTLRNNQPKIIAKNKRRVH